MDCETDVKPGDSTKVANDPPKYADIHLFRRRDSCDNPMTMGITKSVTILCLLAVCAGCGSHPKIRKLSPSSVVVAFGDSLTFGTGADEPESYPSVLAEKLGCRVLNEGVAGEITAAGLARLPGVLETDHPDLVILCHGGNDMLRGQNPGGTVANLNAMIAMAKNAGADVILIGVPKPGLFLKPAAFYREIAAREKIPIDAESLAEILSSPALKSDPAHPNAAGYRQLAEAVATCIVGCQGK